MHSDGVSLLPPVKEKEDAHTDPEFQPMKDDDCTFGEYRWEMLRPLETPEPRFTHQHPPSPPPAPRPPSLPCPHSCSLWLGWSSALAPLNLYSRPTSEKKEVTLFWASTTAKHKNLFSSFLVSGGSPGCQLCRTLLCVCVCVWYDIVLSFKQLKVLQVQRIWGCRCFKSLIMTFVNTTYKLESFETHAEVIPIPNYANHHPVV